MKNKYGNRRFFKDGENWDSAKEYNRYQELLLLQRAGQISCLARQVEYELIPQQVETTPRYHKRTGERIKDHVKVLEESCKYIADFVYVDENGEIVVEDVKGYRKGEAYRVFVIKRKLMLYVHGVRIREV